MVFSCVSSQPVQNDFYLGLLNDSNEEKVKLFEKALNSPNEFIRRSAAEELALLMMEGVELSPKTTEQMQNEAQLWWGAAFDVKDSKEKALSFLLGAESNTPSYFTARQYVLNECEKNGIVFNDREKAVIDAHHTTFIVRHMSSRHAEYQNTIAQALASFRLLQVNNTWPQRIPDLFLQYPNLINDLGRIYVLTNVAAAKSEGHALFLRWEAALPASSEDIKFRLVFYAARIARGMGASQLSNTIALFDRAYTLAPDYEQQDACIWWVLDASVAGSTAVFYERLERYIPKWHNANSFNNILERYFVRLITGREWRRIINTFNLLKDQPAFGKAGYAWAIARMLEEDYLNAEDKRLAARAGNVQTATPEVFYRLAYNAGDALLMPALYYRSQSAIALGLPLLVFEDFSEGKGDEVPSSDAFHFLVGFFTNGAGHFSAPYIRALERALSPVELRAFAEVLNTNEVYTQSMRMISLFIYRDGYQKRRRDFELMYPRPYQELIESNAERFNIPPYTMYGLIRTESAFQSAVVSHAGAVGLAQLMPNTAREQAERIRRGGGPNFFNADGVIDSTNPDLNVYIGSFYLDHQRTSLGDMVLALMAYNGGHTRVRRWRAASDFPVDLLVETVPIYETRDYGRRVPAIARLYKELYY